MAFLAIPDTPYVRKPIRSCVWAVLMGQTNDVFQLVEICRQLVESRTVIEDTRRNFVANSSELGFNIVSYRSDSYTTRRNSVLCRRVWQGAENTREATTLERDLYDNLRERYEICTTFAPPTLDGE